jgi:3-deoxy-D-manno-octulosonate 8-phosphate phosphatase (KDO 8-P phosphatase)
MNDLRALLFDVDGVLTDGKIILDCNGDEIKSFNVRDGQLIDFMRAQGFVFGAISGRKSKALECRLNEMNVDFYKLGVVNKKIALQEFLQKFNFKESEVGYIGDDVIDIEVLKSIRYSFAPKDACQHVLNVVKTITNARGGEGVLREIIDCVINNRSELKSIFHLTYKI